jgi:hypothetical protein
MCGEKDFRCPLPQSEQLYLALKTLGKETALIIYPGQSHSIRRPSYEVDRYRRYGYWYDKFLRGSGVDPTYDVLETKKTTSQKLPTPNSQRPRISARQLKARLF